MVEQKMKGKKMKKRRLMDCCSHCFNLDRVSISCKKGKILPKKKNLCKLCTSHNFREKPKPKEKAENA